MITAIIAVVAVVGGVVGWVVLSGASSEPANRPRTAPHAPTRPTATAIVQEYFSALEQHNLSNANEQLCDGTRLTMTQAEVDHITSVTSNGPARVTGKTAVEQGTVRADDGSSATITVYLGQLPGALWCVKNTASG